MSMEIGDANSANPNFLLQATAARFARSGA